MTEKIFTHIYHTNAWGSKESVSGPTSTLSRTKELLEELPMMIKAIEPTFILDCGCGDFNWMKQIDLTGIQYLGVDIVTKIISTNQENYTKENIHFQKMNLLTEPPETADIWIARDFCCLYGYTEIKLFLEKFLESKSSYLAITSIETDQENTDGVVGSWRPLNLSASPFVLPTPIFSMKDGKQWFRQKYLNVYTFKQIQDCRFLNFSIPEVVPWSMNFDKENTKIQIPGNIPLSQRKLHDHIK